MLSKPRDGQDDGLLVEAALPATWKALSHHAATLDRIFKTKEDRVRVWREADAAVEELATLLRDKA